MDICVWGCTAPWVVWILAFKTPERAGGLTIGIPWESWARVIRSMRPRLQPPMPSFVTDSTTVYLYIRFLDASGNTVGTIFEKKLPVGSGNFTFSGGRARCRYFRFASLVPVNSGAENRKDGSYMRGAQFTNCQLYNGSSYESWGISTARVVSAWKVYPENITLSWTTYNDVFNINHT